MFEIRKAQRQKAKLRIGVSGPSGAGKTFSALKIAKGLAGEWSKVAIIDTEQGSGELYSHLGDYNVIPFPAPYSPERYIEAIQAAIESGAEVVIIDSVTHEWDGKGGALEINDRLAKAKFKGNTWSAWSETTPRHQKFIDAIVTAPCHIITTARSKTDTTMIDGKVKKVGTKEIQREGFEYELTVNFNIDRDKHYAMASKDRTGIFIDMDPFVIDESTGEDLKRWSELGTDAPVAKESVEKKVAKVNVNVSTKPVATKKVGADDGTADPQQAPVEEQGIDDFLSTIQDSEVDAYLDKIDALTTVDEAHELWSKIDSFSDNENKSKLLESVEAKGKELAGAKKEPTPKKEK